jgi:hypothetical protein
VALQQTMSWLGGGHPSASPLVADAVERHTNGALESRWLARVQPPTPVLLLLLLLLLLLPAIAGLAINLVQVFRTKCELHWEFLRLWTGFELSSSWRRLPCYGASSNRNILDFMRWPQIDLGEKDLNGIQRPNSFQNNSWK